MIKSDNAKDERESLGCRGKMAGQQEQVDKVMIMINQQDEHTQLTLPSPPLSVHHLFPVTSR